MTEDIYDILSVYENCIYKQSVVVFATLESGQWKKCTRDTCQRPKLPAIAVILSGILSNCVKKGVALPIHSPTEGKVSAISWMIWTGGWGNTKFRLPSLSFWHKLVENSQFFTLLAGDEMSIPLHHFKAFMPCEFFELINLDFAALGEPRRKGMP